MTPEDLRAFSLDLYDADGLDDTIRGMLQRLRRHLDMEVAFVGEFVEGRRVFRFVDREVDATQIVEGTSDLLEDSYCQRIASSELPSIICDTQANPITAALEVTQRLGIGAYLGVPIRLSNGRVYGTLCCFKGNADHSLNSRDLSFLGAIAGISADLIEKDPRASGKNREARERIESVLASGNVRIAAQPIFDMATRRIVGHEALSRFPQSPSRPPDQWFAEASAVGLGEALEMLAISNALARIPQLPAGGYLSINVSPEHVLSGALLATLEGFDHVPFVIEITEHVPIEDYRLFREALQPLKTRGVKLAVDDAGAGYSNFHHILELEADIIKLDISLIRSIDCENRKYLLAKAICAFAKAIDCLIVAEGIETEGELQALQGLGVNMAQGYLLGRPQLLD